MTTEFTPAMRRSILIATLRDKALWPEGFNWNYARLDGCAIGLCTSMFSFSQSNIQWFRPCPELGLSGEQVNNVFGGCGWPIGTFHLVTPEMVADRLEEMHSCLTQEAIQHSSLAKEATQ